MQSPWCIGETAGACFWQSVIGVCGNPYRLFDRQSLLLPWPGRLCLIHTGAFPLRVCHTPFSTLQHTAIFNRGLGSPREEFQLPLQNLAELRFGLSMLHFLPFSFTASSCAAGKEWLLLNDKIMNVTFEARENGREEMER